MNDATSTLGPVTGKCARRQVSSKHALQIQQHQDPLPEPLRMRMWSLSKCTPDSWEQRIHYNDCATKNKNCNIDHGQLLLSWNTLNNHARSCLPPLATTSYYSFLYAKLQTRQPELHYTIFYFCHLLESVMYEGKSIVHSTYHKPWIMHSICAAQPSGASNLPCLVASLSSDSLGFASSL